MWIAQQRENNWSQIVRLEFPWAEANSQNIDVIAAKLMHLADFVPFACAVGGLGFSYWPSDRFAADQVRAMLPRYIGFEHSDARFSSMHGKTPCPSWLTFVSNELSAEPVHLKSHSRLRAGRY